MIQRWFTSRSRDGSGIVFEQTSDGSDVENLVSNRYTAADLHGFSHTEPDA